MTAVCICLIKGIMVGPAGVGVRRAAGGRTGAGPVMILGAAWAVAAREKARAATVSKEIQKEVQGQQYKIWENERGIEKRKEKQERRKIKGNHQYMH